ncbi:uncharacterized protein C2845_PM07G29190 [Panicum miliaceum]|uniref:Uncharacterized protein n=1 Tax=Panicum miliaceum TaxID=4540 RepID=A0A3L6SLZ8_PANMI|nr:uncharacterized protein C2845_PM07G29190 [Panicum miliaceum]
MAVGRPSPSHHTSQMEQDSGMALQSGVGLLPQSAAAPTAAAPAPKAATAVRPPPASSVGRQQRQALGLTRGRGRPPRASQARSTPSMAAQQPPAPLATPSLNTAASQAAGKLDMDGGLNIFDEMPSSEPLYRNMMDDSFGIDDISLSNQIPFESNEDVGAKKRWARSANYSLIHIQKLYKLKEPKNRPFVMLHCWTLLEHNEKWNNRDNDCHPRAGNSFFTEFENEGDGDEDEEESGSPRLGPPNKKRPPGRKQENERIKKGGDVCLMKLKRHKAYVQQMRMQILASRMGGSGNESV